MIYWIGKKWKWFRVTYYKITGKWSWGIIPFIQEVKPSQNEDEQPTDNEMTEFLDLYLVTILILIRKHEQRDNTDV